MHQVVLIILLCEDEDLFRLNLEQYCNSHNLTVAQFLKMDPEDPAITVRLNGSKRNLMNMLEGDFYKTEVQKSVVEAGEIKELF